MKDQPFNPDYEPEAKKTRKRKAAVPTITSRNTRRGHRKHSSDECPLPEVIPQSDCNQLILFQSFDLQVTRLVLQIPFSLLGAEDCKLSASTRVEATPIEIQILYEGGNIICEIKIPGEPNDFQSILIVHGKYSWLSENEVSTKVIKSSRRALKTDLYSEIVRFKVNEPKSDVFIVLSLRWEEELSKLFRGLVNQGNTCYMNSYLQMLFHLSQFRKLVFAAEVTEKDKFPATLQLLFYRMLTEEKPVSPEELVRSFGWSKKEVQIQQDAQQFSCLFFDALERTIDRTGGKFGSVPDLFCGELVHYIQCCDVGTADFRTQNRQRFYDLQLPLANTLAASLDDYVGQQNLEGDNAYRTDIFGLQDARKGLSISYLPPVLMLQLKRFQFNPYTEANEKILDRCAYPEKMEFSRWTTDPDHQKPYELYAVLVHEGSQASSGHYYVYVNLQGQWFRFNDERVELVEKARALDYNFGGASDIVEYDAKQMKVVQKQIPNKSTAYLLVYVSKQCKKELIDESNKLPEWLIEHTKQKLSLDEEKKLRKQSICDISIASWNKDFKGRECLGSGLAVQADEDSFEEKIEMVPKNQRLDEWLEQLQVGEGEGLCLIWNSMEKEVLINIRSRSCTFVSELFKDVTEPTLFFAPIDIEKDEFLVLVKLYNPLATPKFIFHCCLRIKKDSKRAELYSLLASSMPQSTNSNYYIQDRKNGLTNLSVSDDTLLPAPSPSRNQLLIAIIEQISEEQTDGVSKLYAQELDTVNVIFRDEDRKEYEMELSKRLTVRELRETLFSEIQKDHGEIKSPENLMFKYKTKRNGKPSTEAQDEDILGELVKIDKTIAFCQSSLNASERHLLKEITVHCRDDSFRLSEPIKLVIERSEQDKLLELVQGNENVKMLLPKTQGYEFRCFLLGRDRSFITDLVEDSGRIIGKGDLSTVLQRDKNSILVLQLSAIDALIGEQRINVLVHHVTKTGQRFGSPRIFTLPKTMTLSALRNYLLSEIQSQTYEFQGKNYNFNPFKIRFLAFIKDLSKGFDLPQSKQMIHEQADEQKNDQKQPDSNESLNDRFSKNRFIRVAVIHGYIAKGSQILKLNVE